MARKKNEEEKQLFAEKKRSDKEEEEKRRNRKTERRQTLTITRYRPHLMTSPMENPIQNFKWPQHLSFFFSKFAKLNSFLKSA